MSASHIETFYVNRARYTHFIDTQTDAVILHEQDGKVLLTYDNNAVATDAAGKEVGRFRFVTVDGRDRWAWHVDGKPERTYAFDLLKAEVEESKNYIRSME